jgi:HlyD family secretion protein
MMAAAVVLLFLGIGLISASTDLSGAVIARGSVAVESSVKKVQHATGGIVGELNVQDGKTVEAGELLIRLDDTVVKANATAITKSLWELLARRARLEAERDGLDTLTVPEELAAARTPDIRRIVAGESRLLDLRRTALRGQKAQLTERIGQLREEIIGLSEQIAAKKEEIELIEKELTGLRDLRQRDLVPLSRVVALEREAARLKGDRGRLIAATAQTKGKISETELQVLQLDQDMRSEVAKELADIRAKVAELSERKVAALDQLQRIDIRAPVRGTVHQLAVHTRGGVVTAGEQIMLIVPGEDSLVIDAQISSHDVDRVRLGQAATIRFTSLDQRTTPEVEGIVTHVGADAVTDQKTSPPSPYYPVRVVMAADSHKALNGARLVPGMPADLFIRTSERTILSYLLKPLLDQSRYAFRER